MSGMQMAMMASAESIGTVNINNQSPTDIVTDPADASTAFSLLSNATAQSTGETPPNWLDIPANTGLFEARMTMISGTFSTGPAAGSWFSLGTTRTWTVDRTTLGNKSASATLDIRVISSGVVQDSATITFSATVEI
jgi:hypothetical protein